MIADVYVLFLTRRFGASFILIVFYIILLPQYWNLLVLSHVWLKHPFGQMLYSLGLATPPCCMYEPPISDAEAQPLGVGERSDQTSVGDILYHDKTSTTPSPMAAKQAPDNEDDMRDDDGSIVSSADL